MVTPPKPFDMGNMALGGIGQMLESVEAVQRAWSGMSVPASLMPTVDIDELEKRIADLKAVEQWLNANLAMLRGTIQGMEIQRGTLLAMQSLGASFSQGKPAADSAAPSSAGAPWGATPGDAASGGSHGSGGPGIAGAASPALDPTAWWDMLQRNFAQVAEAATGNSPAGPTVAGAASRMRTSGATPRKRASGAGKAPAKGNGKPAAARGKSRR